MISSRVANDRIGAELATRVWVLVTDLIKLALILLTAIALTVRAGATLVRASHTFLRGCVDSDHRFFWVIRAVAVVACILYYGT